jgi:hypothetical protein
MIPTKEMKKLRAFHGDPAIKDKYVARVRQHAAADAIVKGQYWENGKGCAVGCTIEGSEHARYETELGIPEAIARVEDYLFERMPNEDAKTFPLRLLESIPVGADLSLVPTNLIIFILDDLQNVKEVKEDAAVSKAISDTAGLWKKVAAGKKVEASAWSAAESAAESAAWSAARSAAESAAWSAARSAARSAAESAAESAARSAAESAAWSAARSAAAKRYGDALVRLCAEAK